MLKMSPERFAFIFFTFFASLVLAGSKQAETICCDEIKSLLEGKITAYETLCLATDTRLSKTCCRNVEVEVEKHHYAYKTLCPEVVTTPPPSTTKTPPTIIRTTVLPVVQCNIPLGIEDGSMPDVAMTSSSILNVTSKPHSGRLQRQLGDCAWMPARTADRNSSWLQIDLGNLTNVSAVATQGSWGYIKHIPGSCAGEQWTESYVISFSENGVDWNIYGEIGHIKVFSGNNDSSSVVTNYFETPFAARFVRISPRSWNKNAALRTELFTNSCNYSSVSPNQQTPRSCLDHLKNGLKTNGYYNIRDASSSLVTVYCDMTSERGKAWTLVMSFATGNKDMTEFQSTGYSVNASVDEDLPNWDRYRMGLSRMNDLSAQSTHWRATCSFPTHGVDYVDYVRGKFVDLDVINFIGSNVCARVEYVNIRGQQCSDCDLPWWQRVGYGLHTGSSYTVCGFNASQGGVYKEDNFGYYITVNSKFRCTSGPSATTNWWFGGNLA